LQIKKVLAELKRERKKIDKAIAALEALSANLPRQSRLAGASTGAGLIASRKMVLPTKGKRRRYKGAGAEVIAFPKTAGSRSH
jgi:hypothetical protein